MAMRAIGVLEKMMPKILSSAVVLVLVLALAGCDETDQASTTREIFVAAQRVPCMSVVPMECLQTRESADQPWELFYGDIEGFDFQPGTEYRLRIVETPVLNAPPDSIQIHTRLDQVLEQRKAR